MVSVAAWVGKLPHSVVYLRLGQVNPHRSLLGKDSDGWGGGGNAVNQQLPRWPSSPAAVLSAATGVCLLCPCCATLLLRCLWPLEKCQRLCATAAQRTAATVHKEAWRRWQVVGTQFQCTETAGVGAGAEAGAEARVSPSGTGSVQCRNPNAAPWSVTVACLATVLFEHNKNLSI